MTVAPETSSTTSEQATPAREDDARHPAIRLDGIGRRFGDTVAVSRIDLELAAGEFFALLGPSGCG
ncbi:MAG: hypothetical protein JWP75_3142, partial [Frondihabitans sp.]|nr:hypothetical protein [Frondihabitans sp.]